MHRANQKIPGKALQVSLDDIVLCRDKINFHSQPHINAWKVCRSVHCLDIDRKGEQRPFERQMFQRVACFAHLKNMFREAENAQPFLTCCLNHLVSGAVRDMAMEVALDFHAAQLSCEKTISAVIIAALLPRWRNHPYSRRPWAAEGRRGASRLLYVY